MIPVKWRKLLKKLFRDWEIEFELPIYHINNCLQQQGLINEEEVDKAIFISDASKFSGAPNNESSKKIQIYKKTRTPIKKAKGKLHISPIEYKNTTDDTIMLMNGPMKETKSPRGGAQKQWEQVNSKSNPFCFHHPVISALVNWNLYP